MIKGLVIGSIAALGVAMTTPASAQWGGPGFSVQFGAPGYYGYGPRPYYDGPRYYYRGGPYAPRCRTFFRDTPWGTRRVTRCWD